MQLRTIPILTLFACTMLNAAPANYYPTKAWRHSSPEEQGLDSAVLAAMVSDIHRRGVGIHSITVIRHGNVVLDTAFYPYSAMPAPHDAASLTKSITAVITGIAVQQGRVALDGKMLSYFKPPEAPADPDPLKQKITVEDLLSMQSGLDCGFAPGEKELEEMKRQPNWLRYALALPMKYEPRTHYAYCSPGYHILGGIVANAYGTTLRDFGQKNLFDPLGIPPVLWTPDDQGRTHGWGDSHLMPLDFAKIAYLYLHDGIWEGKQIVPAEWVRKSITKQSDPGRGAGGGYGFGWWLAKTEGMDEFGGNGRGGQRIAIWPEKDMIVIVTGGGYPAGEAIPAIVKSIRSDAPLPENDPGARQLAQANAQASEVPAAEAVSPPPPLAQTISGRRYAFPRNSSRLDSISLDFRGKDPSVTINYLGTPITMPVGLDGRYRVGPWGPQKLPAGAKATWTAPDTLALDINFIANINHYTLVMKFSGDQVEVNAAESSGLMRNGHLTGTTQKQ